MSVNVKYALERVLGLFGLKELKEKQKEALLSFINGNDVFVFLSTIYGKSIIYGILPLVYDILKSKKSVEFIPLHLECAFGEIRFTKPIICCHHLLHCSHYAWTHALDVLIALTPCLKTTGSPVVF